MFQRVSQFALAALFSSSVVSQTRSNSSAVSTPIINVDDYPNGVLNATAWSLIYTYPLAIFANFAGSTLQNVDVNEISHSRTLASPDNPSVVKPNVDTLYSKAVLDLSNHDVVLTVPEIGHERYWVYPVYDPFGNVLAEIGVVNGNTAGQYLIRRADDVFAEPGFDNSSFTLRSLREDADHELYQGVVNLPGSYATMLIRLLVLQNTTAELHTLNTYQNASKLTTIARSKSPQCTLDTPLLETTALNSSFLGIQTPAQQLEFAARFIPYNQPIVYSERYRAASILSQAGLYNGHYHAPELNLTQAAWIANASLTADVDAHRRYQGNDYWLQIPSYQAFYGTHHAAAAYVALGGYQQQTVKQTLYPGYTGLGFSALYHLPPNSSWLFTFSAKPKVRRPGFWSLAVYGADQYLIKNPLNRYEVGDRTYDLTYQDGEHIYGPNANVSRDGPFQILLQSVEYPPPANWTSNWLPGEDTFYMLLRWYVPEPALTDGSYIYPKIQNVSRILA